MLLSLLLPGGEGLYADRVERIENALFNVRISFLQAADQLLDLFPLAFPDTVSRMGDAVRKVAGALDEFQAVVAAPGDDILLLDAVEGPDQLHTGEILAVELRHHALQLGTVEHGHDGGLDDVVQVVPEGNLVASQLPRLIIQETAPHSGAEIAGAVRYAVRDIKDV